MVPIVGRRVRVHQKYETKFWFWELLCSKSIIIWRICSVLRGALQGFFQILERRSNSLKAESQTIYAKLEKEFQTVAEKVDALEHDWGVNRPTGAWASSWPLDRMMEWFKRSHDGKFARFVNTVRHKDLDGKHLWNIFKLVDETQATNELILKFGITTEMEAKELYTALRAEIWSHVDVASKLAQYEKDIGDVEGQFNDIRSAKEAMSLVLELAENPDEVQVGNRIANMKAELEGLNEVHDVLTSRLKQLDAVRGEMFHKLDSKELAKKLRQMQQDLSKLPAKMRQYEAFVSFDQKLQDYKRINKLFEELTSGVLRPKHQQRMKKALGLPKPWSQLTVGDMFDARLNRFMNEINEILTTARGEMALEEFLKDLGASWGNTKFEMADFKQVCWLVRNWNDLITDVADKLSEVMSMKQSPFFKAFATDAAVYEDKLNSAQEIFDLWIDVQRRWVYLQGVFTNSQDVQRQLSVQYDKFQRFNKQFVHLMKSCYDDPYVDSWIGPDKNLFGVMEGHANTLNVIQKALCDYLESQRAAFSRFYFVGDEDLLEIIGNAREPMKINRHLPKMFAGLARLLFEGEGEDAIIVGMESKEGERVMFKDTINVKNNPSIQDWLAMVEFQMRNSLAVLLEEAVSLRPSVSTAEELVEWIGKYPAQVCLLATQVTWSQSVEDYLVKIRTNAATFSDMEKYCQSIIDSLSLLSSLVLGDIPADTRQKYEQLITEMVYQRNMTRTLIELRVDSETNFVWLYRMRFYFNTSETDVLKKLEIRISRAKFYYGFEYLGVAEKLVQTPLTDKAYLTLCEALHARMGGNPFGPAGTGKTESVKSLGAQLGRFVLVFCCDENFDFNAMGRIFVGLCQTGGWGCFDEFNRLEERILSAVSQQILTIQNGLKEGTEQIVLLDKKVRLQESMGIFVTMNPGYAGRSELPDNLKQLFRGMAMIVPNRELIGQVMLFSQGFVSAEMLAQKIVLLFQLCDDQLSEQSHYDFGLRALKSVLRSAGNIKRQAQIEYAKKTGDNTPLDADQEEEILIRSLMSTVVPKLVNEDKFLFESLLESAFPGANVQGVKMDELRDKIRIVAKERHLVCDDDWLEKLLELYVIQTITHGVMLVGPSGGGKTAARDVLLEAMERVDMQKSVCYVLDPKAIHKDELYGVLDPTTLEWTDGVFTHILRSIIDNVRGEADKRHWIVFDGDVDPEWAENLNSVLDDNKMLTLPNGERLALTPNIRIIFETPNLDWATQATVSRCGMVWFSHGVVKIRMMFHHELKLLETDPIKPDGLGEMRQYYQGWERIQKTVVDTIRPVFEDEDSFIWRAMEWVKERTHVMRFTELRAVRSLFTQLRGATRQILSHNETSAMSDPEQKTFIMKFLACSTIWAFAGPMKLAIREDFCTELAEWIRMSSLNIELPRKNGLLIDHEVRIDDQEFHHWDERVTRIDITADQVVNPNFVISTVDTLRHEYFIGNWLQEKKLVILCGPPGSGKSMTLAAVLRANPQYEMVTLNFSSTAMPDMIFACFDQYCKIVRRNQGYVMMPSMQNKILVIFCDEINLPCSDDYGTMKIITFLRQMLEKGGYWRPEDKTFITLERIQFVGACNPPTDPGRNILTQRFLNHCPLILVDFPGRDSLHQIYGTFNRGLLKMVNKLSEWWEPLTEAMLDVYQHQQRKFTADMQPHYVYSPRELSRWTRGIYRALEEHNESEYYDIEDIVRIWAHEALRLFHDRLVSQRERDYTSQYIDEVAKNRFPNIDLEAALQRPILLSNWLSQNYESVSDEELRNHLMNRLKQFQEEELDVKLVLYNEALDHVLRIDRVLRQPLGHLLLVGASGAGKTVLSRFVAWMNSMKTFQIKVHRGYTADDFDNDLRAILIRSGVEREKIAFIFDESNVLDTAFLERMNALLASGEVPGLFEDAEYVQLMGELKKIAQRESQIFDSEEELYQEFCTQVQRNLHIVFTMNPAGDDFKDRSSTSPALFNRCVINWFGTWPETALFQVAKSFTEKLDLAAGNPKYAPAEEDVNDPDSVSGIHLMVSNAIVGFHGSVETVMKHLGRQMAKSNYVTPRHYLDLINHFVKLFTEKRQEIEELQSHLNMGLRILNETEEDVAQREIALSEKEVRLRELQAQTDIALNQMMAGEKEAKTQKAASEKLQKEVEVQMVEIAERTEVVQNELGEAGPALEKARTAVKGIKKKHLEEIRNFNSPPPMVKKALECVCIMLGVKPKKAQNWRDVRQRMSKPGFITDIVNFDTDTITGKMRKIINKDYLGDPNFTFEKVNKASIACGPMVTWASAQMRYSHLLATVEPMRNEIKELEKNAEAKQQQSQQLQEEVQALEVQIEEYKVEYSKLMQKQTELKNEMSSVQLSLSRAKQLIQNLSGEKERWHKQSMDFTEQIATVVGDSLLCAGFLTYLGYYNHTYRKILLSRWKDQLNELNIDFQESLALVQYLSSPTQRLEWKQANLPEDDLCVENAIILQRFNRFPLLVDPAGQGSSFLLECKRSNKMIRTSFLDVTFLKSLESSLRFGNSLLIDDVESMDPILNPVLNKEIQKVGGRQLVRLGDKDIDFNPLFSIFLCTRDPYFDFTPDLCSRVTFVNFAMTPDSLQTQCLSKILRSEAPKIDETRTNQLKLQGEFKVRLRELEDKLLDALNEITGNILDDDNVMTTLETLNDESDKIKTMAEETEEALEHVKETLVEYEPFAKACSKLYFTLARLNKVHFLYQFSLTMFLEVVDHILKEVNSLPEIEALDANLRNDRTARIEPLLKALHRVTYVRTKRSLKTEDVMAFGMRIAQIYLDVSDNEIHGEHLSFLLKGKAFTTGRGVDDGVAKDLTLSSLKKTLLENLYATYGFGELRDVVEMDIENWREYISGADIEPPGWEGSGIDGQQNWEVTLENMCLNKVFRPDKLVHLGAQFLENVFGWNLHEMDANPDTLATIVLHQTKSDTPLVFASTPGNDPSSKIDDLAAQHFGSSVHKCYQSMAMGSPEGYNLADVAVNKCAKKGHWICLKNVHLSTEWLTKLEKKLHRMDIHRDFRLFLTMEINPRVSSTLLRRSCVLIYEPPLGVKASLTRTYNTISSSRVNKMPTERSRLYVLLAWLHAIILERLRFEPVGWTKKYEFSETDLKCACDGIDEWIDKISGGRVNIDPNDIPWDALHAMLIQYVYGGRVDNYFDTTSLESFVKYLFSADSFNKGFPLSEFCANVSQGMDIGRLCYVMPGNIPPEAEGIPQPAKIAEMPEDGDEVRVCYLAPNVIFGEHNVPLRSEWVKLGDCQVENFEMRPLIECPDTTKYNEIKKWIGSIPDEIVNSPVVLGLTPRAELMLLERRSQKALIDVLKLQDIDDGDEDEAANIFGDGDDEEGEGLGSVPKWMKQVASNCDEWISDLAEEPNTLIQEATSMKNPLYRLMRREFDLGMKLFTMIHRDLMDVKDAVFGEAKASNYVRLLIEDLYKDFIPKAWNLYAIDEIGLSVWFRDLGRRFGQLIEMGNNDFVNTPHDQKVWLGGMFQPGGFVAATRQYVAQKKKWPLEDLELNVDIGVSEPTDSSFIFEGLTLFGAGYSVEQGCLVLTEKTSEPLGPSRFRWVLKEDQKKELNEELTHYSVPIYLNKSMKNLVISAKVRVFRSIPSSVWSQRAVSMTVWAD